jgi:AmmeMemoRadiSam system protein A
MVLKLTEIARKKLEAYFDGKDFELDRETKEKYKEEKACFVTLTRDGELRGCVGSLQAHQSLWKDVLDNTSNAAFNDTRFKPLEKKELNKIEIEVSVLTKPERLFFESSDELLRKVDNKMGIILKKGFLSATFLPQVWEQIPFKQKFFEQLSLKAGLSKDAWKEKGIEISYYRVEVEKED